MEIIKNKDMRTIAKDFLMDGNERFPFRDVIDNLDEEDILDCMEEYADYKVAKEIKTEDLFTNLNNTKQEIAEVFSKKYFNSELDLHWIGEILLIGDHYLQLDDIEFALKTEMEEESLFHFLKKPRKYNLENFWIGKVGRKEKRKQELKKCKENVNYAWGKLQEAIVDEHFENSAEKEYMAVLNTTGMFYEWYPQLLGNWEKDKFQWLDIYKEMCESRNSEKNK